MKSRAEYITSNIDVDQKLWRYMSLDKLINLLNKKELFFTPVENYANSDPFEGLQPKSALDAIAGILRQSQSEMLEQSLKVKAHAFTNSPFPGKIPPQILSKFEELENEISLHTSKMEQVYFNIMKCVVVNCWHQNNFESEAMWKLYSDSQKGVAIQTTLKSLIDSIDDEKEDRIYFSEIKYIDYDNPDLQPQDCVVNGNIGPLLKRKSFEHENEARLYFTPNKNYSKPEESNPKPEFVKVDTDKLIEKVYISPYAVEPYPSSVECILKIFGIGEDKIIRSSLLKPDNNLLKMF